MNKITKILGIAPYEGMKSLMVRLAETRDDLDLTVYVGDLEIGAEIALRHTLEDFDIILSRGGTAALISATSPIPVVEIQLSVYDILRAIKLAENYSDRYAIVGYPEITKNAHFLCDLLQYNIDIYTIHSPNEVNETLSHLVDSGYSMVLCDVVTNSNAQRLGIRSILFTSGTESIEAAFDQAVKTAGTYRGLVSKTEFFRTLLENYLYHIFVYDTSGELIYVSKDHTFSHSLVNSMKYYVPEILEEKDKKFYRDEGGLLISVRGIRKEIHKQTYVAYYVNSRKVPLSLIKNGFRYIDKDQALEQFFAGVYGLSGTDNSISQLLDTLNQTTDPVILYGEPGTGPEQIAGLVYAKSQYRNKPMAIIDCRRITDKGWSYLTEHTNSPFSDTYTTIYIRDLEFLSEDRFQEMFSIIRDLNLYWLNRIIFSCSSSQKQFMERCELLENTFSCRSFHIPPMRSYPEKIPDLANLCISVLNMELAHEVAGLEPEAAELLQRYSWPQNFEQFRRVMRELVLTANTPYIKAVSVSRLLQRQSPPDSGQADFMLNLNQPLEDINLDILKIVLSEENGNQSAAAKRLCISRTTLWRMLQKIEAEK